MLFRRLLPRKTKSSRAEHNALVRQVREEIRRRPPRPEYLRTRKPVIEDLKLIGCEVNTLEDLKYDTKQWKIAIPVLIDWLNRIEGDGPDGSKEELARLLAVPFAKGAEPALISAFHLAKNDSLKWAIGNSLCVLASPRYSTELLEIARNPAHGQSRQMVVYSLAKLKHPGAFDVAVECLKDDMVALHAIHALKMMKDSSAVLFLEPLSNNKNTAIRREAKKAIERLSQIHK